MKMARLIKTTSFVLLAVILTVALVGCGSNAVKNTTKSNSTTTQQESVKSNSVSTQIAP